MPAVLLNAPAIEPAQITRPPEPIADGRVLVSPDDYRGPSHFVHLHNHTVYSTLDGVATPDQYAAECKKRGYPAMSATEHGNMGSVPDMYMAFKKVGLKYIPGCEIYFCDYEPERRRRAKLGVKLSKPPTLEQGGDWDAIEDYHNLARARHLTVLAKNEIGYTNLIKLTTQAYATGFYRRPRVWFDKLCEFKEGLIVLSGCLNGPICHELRRHHRDGDRQPRWKSKDGRGAIDWVKKFSDVFGEDYYIEGQMPGIPGDDWIFRTLITIADKYKKKFVLANDCHYLERVDYELQTIMMAIDQGVVLDENLHSEELFHVNSSEQYMKTRAELWARFRNCDYSKGIDDRMFETMCDNTLEIAEKCKGFKANSAPKIPNFDGADNQLGRIVATKLKEMQLHKSDRRFQIDGREVTYVQQAKIELERITEKGFSSYFLITQDLIRYGKDRGWPFNPRGSASGSLVCYLLGISPIDPLPWGLSFDRFLSPSRGGFMVNMRMPD
jgi:DNA polymerase-3 subunit alpha